MLMFIRHFFSAIDFFVRRHSRDSGRFPLMHLIIVTLKIFFGAQHS